MAVSINMPQLGLTMTEGMVGRWFKKVGDMVNAGEPILEITTDKLTSDVESPSDGTLLAIIAFEGDEVAVQGVLGYIGVPGEQIDDMIHGQIPAARPVQENIDAPLSSGSFAFAAKCRPDDLKRRAKVSPLARKTAQKKDIDISILTATGPGGRIVQRDVLAVSTKRSDATFPVPSTTDIKREKLTGMRKVVAERMLSSHAEIPSVTQNMRVDMTELMKLRSTLNKGRSDENRFSLNDLILKAVAKVLTKNRFMLVSLVGEEIVYHDDVNLGVAVAVDNGLIVPVIRNADRLELEPLSIKVKDMSKRARDGNLTTDEYRGSTFTVSNLGMYGIETFTPIINQPNAAILGICTVQGEIDIDDDGNFLKRHVMRISLTYDHRLLDGAIAAKFQMSMRDMLERPLNILL
jgi:pyruvate dehydrogenase E2 component (dihydrolipoamide acetyltransferase)